MLQKICQSELIRETVRRVCTDCGAPVSHYTCNEALVAVRPEAANWDYWAACDNTGCYNHAGEGVFQTAPLWEAKL